MTSAQTALERALDWIERHIGPDGSVRGGEMNIAAYYKLPFALAAGGRTLMGHRVLTWVRGQMTQDGDFAPSARGRIFSRLYPYPNSWLIAGAHRLGRLDISRPGARFLLRFQDSWSGAFRSMPPEVGGGEQTGAYVAQAEAQSADTAEVMCTAMAGFALLYVGHVDAAGRAGDFLCRLLSIQPEPKIVLYTMYDLREQRLITTFPEHLAPAFAVDSRELRQYYFQVGIAAAFLAKLFEATGDERYLATAKAYLDFIEGCREDKFATPQSGKLAWGAAYVSRVTGEPKYLEITEEVIRYLCESQHREGCWCRATDPTGFPTMMDATNEFAAILAESLAYAAGRCQG